MKLFDDLKNMISRKPIYGVGVLQDNIEAPAVRGGFSQAKFEERRAAARVEIDVPVWYSIKNSWEKWLLGRSINYSSTGIRLLLPAGVKKGTELSLRMKMPGNTDAVNVNGIVVWTEPSAAALGAIECGIAFQNIRKIRNKESFIYHLANKICQVGLHLTRHLKSVPVESIEDLRACYKIVYEGYLSRKYCAPNEQKMHYSFYSLLPTSRTFILKDKERPLGTITLVVDSPCGLAIETLFPREVEHLRKPGRKIAEVTLLAMTAEEKRKRIFSLTDLDKQMRLFRLFKVMYEYAENIAGVTDLVIGVHPKHETLYKYLNFKAMAAAKDYPGARGNPALPMHLDLVWAKENYSSSLLSFFLAESTAQDVLKSGLVLNSEVVQKLLCEERDMWSTLPPKAQKFIKQSYPGVGPGLKKSLFNFLKG